MSPEKLMLGINIVVIIFMAIGFLKGREGLKYTLVRFLFFLLAIGLSLIFMDTVAEKLASAKIVNGNSLGDLIVKLISSNQFLSGMYNGSDKVKQVVDQLPKVFLQSISYTITLIFFMIICGIAYRLLKHFVLKNITWFDIGKKPEADPGDKKAKKQVSSRSKLYGGLMGMIYGFVTLMFIIMPLSGVVNTVSKIINTPVSAEETVDSGEERKSAFGETFETVKDYINAYHSTPLGFASGIGGMDIEFTRKISSVKIDGKRISIIDKVENMKSIYSDVVYFADFKENYKDLSSINELDLTKAKSLINYILDNQLLDSLFDEVTSYTIEYSLDENRIADAELRKYVTEIYNQMQIKGSPKLFVQDEICNLLDVGQIVIDSEIFTEVNKYAVASQEDDGLTQEEIDERKLQQKDAIRGMFEKILSEAENEKSYLSNAIAQFNNSKASNVTANFVFNKVLGSIEKTIIQNDTEDNLAEGILGRVELSDDFNFEQIGDIVDRMARIYDEISVVDLAAENNVKELLKQKTELGTPLICDVVTKIGDIVKFATKIDSLQAKPDGNKTILENLCYYLPKANLLDFVNIEYIDDDSVIDNEVTIINNILNKFIQSTQFETIMADDFEQSKMADEIVSFLAYETNTNYITQNILSTMLFKNLVIKGTVSGAKTAGELVTSSIGSTMTISEVNTSDMFETEKDKIADFLEKAVKYYDGIKGENIAYNVLESDLVTLGDILDNMREVKLFADYGSTGYYKDLMLAIDGAYSDYLNLEVATHDSFSWKDTMVDYGDALKSYLSHAVNDNGKDAKMIDVIMGKTEVTFDEALSQLTPAELFEYYTSLSGCEIINPITQILLSSYISRINP